MIYLLVYILNIKIFFSFLITLLIILLKLSFLRIKIKQIRNKTI